MKNLFKALVVMLVAFMLVGCSGNKTEGGDATTKAFKLGASGPLTGEAAIYGKAVETAAKIAVEEINAAEGYTFFDFKIEDDEASPEKAPNAFGALMDWGMQVSLYAVTSGAGAAVAKDYYDNRIFAITPSASNTAVIYDNNTNYDNCFQICFTDPNQGTASADYIKEHNLGSSVFVIYNNEDNYSTGIFQTFMAQAKNIGLNVVGNATFDNKTSDFSTAVLSAQAANADVVFLPIYHTPASLILTEAAKNNFAPVFFGCDGMDGILGIEGFDTTLANGLYMLTPFAADATDDKTVAFVEKYKAAANGEVPNQFAADAYDAVYVIYNAIKDAGVTADQATADICSAIIAQVTSMTYEGLTGTATWAVNGEVSKSPKAVVINNGVYVNAE